MELIPLAMVVIGLTVLAAILDNVFLKSGGKR